MKGQSSIRISKPNVIKINSSNNSNYLQDNEKSSIEQLKQQTKVNKSYNSVKISSNKQLSPIDELEVIKRNQQNIQRIKQKSPQLNIQDVNTTNIKPIEKQNITCINIKQTNSNNGTINVKPNNITNKPSLTNKINITTNNTQTNSHSKNIINIKSNDTQINSSKSEQKPQVKNFKIKNFNTFNTPSIENLVLGVQTTKTKTITKDMINNYNKRYNMEKEEFKNKDKYLQNIPYKAIHDNSAFQKQITNKNDLIIYKLSKKDKNKIEVEKGIANIINDRKRFNMEQDNEYKLENKERYKQQFEHELIRRFRVVPVTNLDNNKLKKESYKFHEKCQEELERNQQNVDLIIEEICNTDVIY